MNNELPDKDRNMMLQYLLISANELDAEIRSINDTTLKLILSFPFGGVSYSIQKSTNGLAISNTFFINMP
ncbi:hypothetical protein A0256_13085 [Mucilaginibacter sp. PAMC 26640]|nr:hypothetical protein A0256_13085 [Mucilaginibacter sp. PAMC 26640]